MSDDTVRRLRDEITAIDREIFAAVNRRLDAVSRLKHHKAEHGIAFVDPNREAAMFAEREAENEGPLSNEGLRAFYAELLALTKREV
jgi:chorismate mutase / prephenate dehydratase